MNKYQTTILFLFLLLAVPVCGRTAALNLGVVGKRYPIKERDALDEIEARARKVNWKKEEAKIKPENHRPAGLRNLPRVKKAKSFLVDMSYTLDTDIPDGKGGILYPRGYSFNPLDYVPFRETLVVINAEDKEQVEWFKKSPYAGRFDTKLLITKGSFVDTIKTVKQAAFYAAGKIVDRLQLKAVPSVVREEGRYMRVDEILVPKGNGGHS